MVIIIDWTGDFIDERDYKEDGKHGAMITDLEEYIKICLRNQQFVDVKFVKEDLRQQML